MIEAPLTFQWTGEEMVPLNRFVREANRRFIVGETYRMDVIEERSIASHNHFFALVHEAWRNLPEHLAERWPTDKHLRAWALIKAGYRDERSIVCASKAEALRVKAFIRPLDEYGVVLASEAVVTVYTAKTQGRKAMGKEAFQASKEAVLGILADLIGTDPKTLSRQSLSAPVVEG